MNREKIHIALVFALTEECDAFYSAYNLEPKNTHRSERLTGVVISSLKTHQNLDLSVATVDLQRMGSIKASRMTAKLLEHYEPVLIANLGLAAIQRDPLQLGDVACIETTFEYQEGAAVLDVANNRNKRVYQQIENAFSTAHADINLCQWLRDFPRADFAQYLQWREYAKEFLSSKTENQLLIHTLQHDNLLGVMPKLIVCDSFSGPFVVKSDKFKLTLRGRNRNPKIIEMEAYGFLAAVQESPEPRPRALVLRGVSDNGDPSKSRLDESSKGIFRQYALRNAIDIFAFTVARLFPLTTSPGEPPKRHSPPTLTLHDWEQKHFESVSAIHLPPEYANKSPLDQGHVKPIEKLFSFFLNPVGLLLDKNDLFQSLFSFITQSYTSVPLHVVGEPGSGKTAFLSYFYLYCRNLFVTRKTSFLPVYLNLHKYNSEIYSDPTPGVSLDSRAASACQQHLKQFTSLASKYSDVDFILIIDGLDSFARFRSVLLPVIHSAISSLKNRKIISQRLSSPTPPEDNVLFPIPERTPRLEFGFLSDDDATLTAAVNALISFTGKTAKRTAIRSFIIDSIRTSGLGNVDMFLLFLLHEEFSKKRTTAQLSLSQLLIRHCHHFLEKSGCPRRSINEIFTEASRLAYEWDTLSTESEFIPEARLRRNRAWDLVHFHNRVKDLLIAFFFLEVILNPEPETSKVQMFDFSAVYQYGINRLCKELIDADQRKRQQLLASAPEILASDNLPLKAEIVYLLGRISGPQNQKQARDLLASQYSLEMQDRSLEGIIESEPLDFCRFVRTLLISRVFLDSQTELLSEVVKLFITDPGWNEFNRGFYLDYYGDIKLEPSRLPVHQDRGGPFDNTYSQLVNRIAHHRSYRLFELEVLTLASLAQDRHSRGELNSAYRKELKANFETLLSHGSIGTQLLRQYLRMVVRHLKRDSFDPMREVFKVLELKHEPRKGWTARNIPNPESIAAHTFGALSLALFFLPEHRHEPDYNKDRILRLLLFHDMMEAFVGDRIPSEKTDENRRQEADLATQFGLLCTYPDLTRLGTLVDLSEELHNGSTTNAKVARAFDKLDNLFQLFFYRSRGNQIPALKTGEGGYEEWRDELVQEVSIDQDARVVASLLERYFGTERPRLKRRVTRGNRRRTRTPIRVS